LSEVDTQGYQVPFAKSNRVDAVDGANVVSYDRRGYSEYNRRGFGQDDAG
jgi:hypothetical protein